MKFGFSKLGVLALGLSIGMSPSHADAVNSSPALYCPGESKLFIGADGRFMQVDKDTYLSWPKAKQESYRRDLDRHVLRTDASAKAYASVVNYFQSNPLEIHRMMEDALNKDANLFPYRRGTVDLLRKAESQMTNDELKAYQSALERAEISISERLAQNNFNAEFCGKKSP
jgi:hypothetical protein